MFSGVWSVFATYDRSRLAISRWCSGRPTKGDALSDDPLDDVSGGALSLDNHMRDETGDGAAARAPRVFGTGLAGAAMRVVPWLVVLGVATVVLLQAETPALDIARYGAYWCFGVTLPGLLVVRAALGSRGNWPEDVALGAVAGLGLELLFFAVWSLLGLQQLLWLWPLVVVAVFAAVPRLRRHWRIGSPKPLPSLWSWGVASAIASSTVFIRQQAMAAPMPPAGGYYYPDLNWHLSIAHELTRSFPPQVPQVVGEVLRYHWFSHVHMAAAHLVSGAPEATVVLRLWILPLVAVTALIGARLAMELSGRWWSGPLAAWALVVLTGTGLLPVAGESVVTFPKSPSQVYVLPLVLGVALLASRALRGIRLGVGWAILVLLLVAAAGSKPTAMPLILAGTCLAGLTLVVRRSRQWRAAAAILAAVVVIFPLSYLAVVGSDSGSVLSLFDFVEWNPLYHSLTGAGFHPAVGPILPAGVMNLTARSLTILAILLAVPLASNIGRLVPFGWLGSKRMRTDPAAWFLAGVVIAGWFVYFVLSHPAYSQGYFLRLANPVASVFGVWALAAAVPATVRSGRRGAVMVTGGTLFGFGVVALARGVTPSVLGHTEDLAAVEVSFLIPLAVVGVAIVAGLVTWRLARRRVRGLRGWGSAVVLAALVLGGPLEGVVNPIPDPRSVGPVAPADKVAAAVGRITPSAAAAMSWVDLHTPQDAVVATNRHCANGPERPHCQATAFWVNGLGGRHTVLEGWGYNSASKYSNGPTPFPERLAVNDAVFTTPSVAAIDRLRREYGATWLVADRTAGPVSPELAQLAEPRFVSGPVTVYQLR